MVCKHILPLFPPPSVPLSLPPSLPVILSPSGLNAMMTGHSYQTSDTGITNILREWELFYPRRFSPEPTPGLPAAIEVVLGGVRLRYPSQFVFVYHGDDSLSTPPPSPLEERSLVELMEGSWSDSNCLDVTQQQRDSILCRCQETIRSHTHRRPSSQLDLPLRDGSRHSARYEPYPSRSKARELSTPGSLSLMNIPQLSAKNKLSRHGLPKYTTPLSSPALAPPPSSSSSSHPSLLHKPQGPPLPTISLDAAPNTTGKQIRHVHKCARTHKLRLPPSSSGSPRLLQMYTYVSRISDLHMCRYRYIHVSNSGLGY